MTITSGVMPTTRSQSRSQDILTIWGAISRNLKLPYQNRQNQLGYQNQNRNENQNQRRNQILYAEILIGIRRLQKVYKKRLKCPAMRTERLTAEDFILPPCRKDRTNNHLSENHVGSIVITPVPP